MSFLASLFGTNFGLSYFTFEEVMLRLSLAIIMGFLIGWERDYKNKPIDFSSGERTFDKFVDFCMDHMKK